MHKSSINQQILFHESILEAVASDVSAAGLSRKEAGCMIWPHKSVGAAESHFSRALSGEGDLHLPMESLETIITRTGGDNIVRYICLLAGYEVPQKKTVQGFEADIREGIEKAAQVLQGLTSQLAMLTAMKEGCAR